MASFLVEPRGNELLLKTREGLIDVTSGLGPVFVAIGGTEHLNERLFPYLSSKELCILSTTSRALWTLITADEALWREIALLECSDDELDSRLREFVNWKSVAVGRPCNLKEKLKLGRLFSDAILRPLHCASIEFESYWLDRENVARECFNSLSVEDFIKKYEESRIPVVISGVEHIFKRGIERWSKGLLLGMNSLGNDRRFKAGPRLISSLSFAEYTQHMAHLDESPLYIFDPRFAETFSVLREDYEIPKYFKGKDRDLLELLGPESRPDFRWIIAGAPKSGSKWHVDPNCTHAWNASLKGKKKWVMLPPWGPPPPGVFPSADGGSVAQPVSLIEWFLEFYKEARKHRERELIEFVADVGDLVFVPSGWWHAVLNLEESFAVTQNYISKSNLARAIRFFEQKPDQISGLRRVTGDRKSKFAEEFKAVIAEDLFSMIKNEENQPVKSWSSLVRKPDAKGEIKPFTFAFNL